MTDGITLFVYGIDAAVYLPASVVAQAQACRDALKTIDMPGDFQPTLELMVSVDWYAEATDELTGAGCVSGRAIGIGRHERHYAYLSVSRSSFYVRHLERNDRGVEQWVYSTTVFYDNVA